MLSFFPRGVLDEILNLIESVSEGFPFYSSITDKLRNINSVCRCRLNIATQKWKINCWKIEVAPLVIKPSIKLSIVIKSYQSKYGYEADALHYAVTLISSSYG